MTFKDIEVGSKLIIVDTIIPEVADVTATVIGVTAARDGERVFEIVYREKGPTFFFCPTDDRFHKNNMFTLVVDMDMANHLVENIEAEQELAAKIAAANK